MQCFVCGSEMPFYFNQIVGGDKMAFHRCCNCGLVINKSVYEMSQSAWKQVNAAHKTYQGSNCNVADPRWISRLQAQAKVLTAFFDTHIFTHDMLIADYGCGDGKLADYVAGYGLGNILKYDAYMRPKGKTDYLNDDQMLPGAFDGIITCSVFEHLIGRDDVDKILSLLNDTGTFCLHTLVCEDVPRDPNWFYISHPCHCTLWSNKAMAKLYQQYGFAGCAYNLDAQMWFFFRDPQKYKRLVTESVNIQGEWTFSDGFIDYWKCEPYRH